MVKLLLFAILLASSPANGLLETLFRAENSCYSGCQSNFAASTDHLKACKQGCDFKFHNEDCTSKCGDLSKDESIRNSCQVGCTLSRSTIDESVDNKPILAIDPIEKPAVTDAAPVETEPERPHSIILIRLRQRPSFDGQTIQMPSPGQFLSQDPIQFFNDLIRQFKEKAGQFDQSIRQSIDENSKDLPKFNNFPDVSDLIKTIPIIRLPGNLRADSSSESSEESNDKRPLIDQFKQAIEQSRERVEPANSRVRQFFTNVRGQLNELVVRQPKVPVWIFLAILLSSSAILWYMVMSLCRHTPSRDVLSIRAQELIFHPYEGDAYEKEKIQPDDQPYEVTESLPIKVKFSNI